MKHVIRALWLVWLGLFLASGASAQTSITTTSSSTSGCATIVTDTDKSTVGVQVTGTWTGTLQPQVAIQGQAAVNTAVTPTGSSTTQTTITANGLYTASVAGTSTFQVCGPTGTGTAVVWLNVSKAAVKVQGGGGGTGFGSARVTNPVDFGAKWDTHYVGDATLNSGSNIISSPTFSFLTNAKVGQQLWALTGGPLCQATPASTVVAQTTVLSVDSATQIHSTANATANAAGNGCLVVGDDDTTAINAAWAAGGCGGSMVLPQGFTIFSAAIMQKLAGCPSAGSSPYVGQSVGGQGVGSTYLIPAFTFNFTNCQTGAATGACVGNPNVEYEHDYSVFGLGLNNCGVQSFNLAMIGIATRSVNQFFGWWCPTASGANLVGVYINGSTFIAGGVQFFGSVQLSFAAQSVLINGFHQGSPFTVNGICPFQLTASAQVNMFQNTFTGCWQTAAGGGVLVESTNTVINTAGTETVISLGLNSKWEGHGDTINTNPNNPSNALTFSSTGAVATFENSTLFGNGGAQAAVLGVANNTYYDVLNNTYTLSNGAVVWNGVGKFVNTPRPASCTFAATTCSATFQTPFNSAPTSCAANDTTAAAPVRASALTTTTVTLTGGTGAGATDVAQVVCQ